MIYSLKRIDKKRKEREREREKERRIDSIREYTDAIVNSRFHLRLMVDIQTIYNLYINIHVLS